MHWLPALASFVCAVIVTQATIGALRRAGIEKENYRGHWVPTSAGLAVVAAAVVSLLPLALIGELLNQRVFFHGRLNQVLIYALGVALLGAIDDVIGHGGRGFRGHWSELRRGQLSTGALKAIGSLSLALYVLSGQGMTIDKYLLETALLVFSTNLFNLFDLRPGRAIKLFFILGAAVWVGTQDTETVQILGLFIAPLIVLFGFDLKERSMLGDAGSNLIGAIAGIWLVFSLSTTAQALALVVVVALTAYGEFRSLGKAIEKTPLLRALDSMGRE